MPHVPNEVIYDILSLLSVKSLVRLGCMSKPWNTLISDPVFVKTHLKKWARKPTLFLSKFHYVENDVIPFSTRRLPNKLSVTVGDDWIVGSCNGLLCLFRRSFTIEYADMCISLWNPATGKRSRNLGSFRCKIDDTFVKFAFGYDNSIDTYKIVALHLDRYYNDDDGEYSWRSQVKIFSLADNIWRNIQNLPAVPLCCDRSFENVGVYLSGTVNWLALRDYSYDFYDINVITIEQFVIISLDLGSEIYKQLLPPRGFDEVPYIEPILCTMMDCLYFCHEFEGTHFVIWKMTEFGVEEWTQLFRISYQDLQNGTELEFFQFQLFPLCFSENGDTLILAHNLERQAILYDSRDNRVRRTSIVGGLWWPFVVDYVESLVSIC